MCFGWTYICWECGRIEYSIREHCGESQPFPAWHHVNGHTDRNTTCADCLRRQERALLEESIQIARQHESKFAVKDFIHGERQTYLTDQEIFQRSRDVLNAYSRNERLHPFTEQHIARAREAIEAETENLDMNIRAGLLNCFDDMVRRQSEIDATGRAITDIDRINSYDAIQGQMNFDVAQAEIQASREPFRRSRSPSQERPGLGMARGPPRSPTRDRGPPGQRAQQIPAPHGFSSFILRYYQENPRPADEDAAFAPEAVLLADAEHYLESLAVGTEHFNSFLERFAITRLEDMRTFDFIPMPNPAGLVATFRQWLGNQRELLSLIRRGDDRSVDAWLQAIYLYAGYLGDNLALVPKHLNAFVRARRELADSERRLYNTFYPTRLVHSRDMGDTPGRVEPPAIVLSFYEWVRIEYADRTVRRAENIFDALGQDMAGYERYLQRTATNSQLNPFQLLRTGVADNTFEFTPALPRIPSLLDWLNRTNERRRRCTRSRRYVDLVVTDILGDYAINVLRNLRFNVPPEILLDWETAETQYAEENRRQMYGFTRGSLSPVVEPLRESRNVIRDLVYNSAEYWALSPANPVMHETRSSRSFLRRCIATEQGPSPEQWRIIGEHMAQAQTILREEGERRNEGWINERARNPVPRTPQTIDGDASTVTDSPLQRQQGRFPPLGDPNFPLDQHPDSDNDFPL